MRSRAWVKHKHRRRVTFVATGWLPAQGSQPESLLVARPGADGALAMAGSVSLGYKGELREQIQAKLAALEPPPSRRRQRVRRTEPRMRVTVDFHGPLSGPLRDPVLRSAEQI